MRPLLILIIIVILILILPGRPKAPPAQLLIRSAICTMPTCHQGSNRNPERMKIIYPRVARNACRAEAPSEGRSYPGNDAKKNICPLPAPARHSFRAAAGRGSGERGSCHRRPNSKFKVQGSMFVVCPPASTPAHTSMILISILPAHSHCPAAINCRRNSIRSSLFI